MNVVLVEPSTARAKYIVWADIHYLWWKKHDSVGQTGVVKEIYECDFLWKDFLKTCRPWKPVPLAQCFLESFLHDSRLNYVHSISNPSHLICTGCSPHLFQHPVFLYDYLLAVQWGCIFFHHLFSLGHGFSFGCFFSCLQRERQTALQVKWVNRIIHKDLFFHFANSENKLRVMPDN